MSIPWWTGFWILQMPQSGFAASLLASSDCRQLVSSNAVDVLHTSPMTSELDMREITCWFHWVNRRPWYAVCRMWAGLSAKLEADWTSVLLQGSRCVYTGCKLWKLRKVQSCKDTSTSNNVDSLATRFTRTFFTHGLLPSSHPLPPIAFANSVKE
jgi:hypothetical protein